jgi:hypothetical protein
MFSIAMNKKERTIKVLSWEMTLELYERDHPSPTKRKEWKKGEKRDKGECFCGFGLRSIPVHDGPGDLIRCYTVCEDTDRSTKNCKHS